MKEPFCTICLTTRKQNDAWFLLVENRWTDRLKILSWHDRLAANPAIHAACCAAHVQLLVIHWMTTGTLNYPFAHPEASDESEELRRVRASSMKRETDTSGAKVLAEIAVHRESIGRILIESPTSLAGILAGLKDALPQQADSAEITETEACKEYVLTEV